eukprot:scpid33100/ scgid31459/ 
MSWNTQMDRCVARLTKKVGVLWRMRRCLSMQSRIQYFKSVIMPDFSYGSNAFSASLAGKHLDRLQVLQNRAARAVYGCSPRTSARNLLVQLGAYRVREIFIQKLIFLVWRCRYSRASPTLQVLLLPTSGAPTRLQLSMGLRPPPTRTELGKGCLAFQGARLWSNALPSEVRAIPHPAQFRTAAVPHSMNP